MNSYEIEHIGICVDNPIEMANWYKDVLGFHIKFAAQDSEKCVAFLTDGSDNVMLELGRLPNILPLTNRMSHPLQLHIALRSNDPDKDSEYLESMGAKFIEKCPIKRPGEDLIILSDPWGNTIQLANRDFDQEQKSRI